MKQFNFRSRYSVTLYDTYDICSSRCCFRHEALRREVPPSGGAELGVVDGFVLLLLNLLTAENTESLF